MKTLFQLTLLLGLLAIAFTAVMRGNYKDPNHPGKCVVRPDLIFSPGTHRHPEMCARVICSENGDLILHTCGVQAVGPGYRFGDYKNPQADYPECCERHIISE